MNHSGRHKPVFGRLNRQSEALDCAKDQDVSFEIALATFLPMLDAQIGSAPNVHRRNARIRGLVEGFIKPLGPVIMTGKTLEAGLADLSQLQIDIEQALADVRASYVSRAVSPKNEPNRFNPISNETSVCPKH